MLSSYPDGIAAPDALNADLAILSGSQDWTLRMRKLAARLPAIDIFSQKLVVRDSRGWQLTAAGRAVLDLLEDRRDLDHCDAGAAAPTTPNQAGIDEIEPDGVAQPKPQLTLIQGGKTRPRDDRIPPGSVAVKGAASRP
ncbi:hypothetical protein SR870_13630 [Rhodopseudomonas palustris]|uniref:hypothetical protein n=1 Tax=Rhodopseudomonas palustris TaxID=1076 RepID=UPI002ACDDE20|nr:hypothetical protein [Rhodopseudomonas palustris]WQG97754.1 hypothetical protein SR870_13630 [Rhodopseudomonas palustris]